MERSARGSALPALHLVTDDAILARGDFADSAAALLAVGGTALALHLRGPGTPGGTLLELLRALREPARAAGALLVVNDRVDVALAGGAGGVQLGARSLALAEARRLLGPLRRAGVSVHSVAEAGAAAAQGADWIFAGTTYETASHPGREGKGPVFVNGVARASTGTPVFAIGGVTPPRVPEVLSAGARGVAVIRGIWDAEDPAEAVRRYLQALDEQVGKLGRRA